ncbi:MAG: PAS domain S-box protein [Negativicutes bacterium]|nr:PAS domain S-box protein [Negativicutes bacterium]
MKTPTLQGQFRLWAILLVVVPSLLIMTIYTVNQVYTARQQNLDLIGQRVYSQQQLIDRWVGDRSLHVRSISQLGVFREGNESRMRQVLETVQRLNPSFDSLSYIDKDGLFRISTLKGGIRNPSAVSQPYFLAGLAGKEYISNVVIGRSSGIPIINFSSPIIDSDGNFQGVILGSVAMTALDALLRENWIGQTGEIFLVDHQGLMLTEVRNVKVLIDKGLVAETAKMNYHITGDAFRHIRLGDSGTASWTDYRDNKVLGAYIDVPERNWTLIGKIDEAEVLAPIYRQLALMGGGALVLVLLILPLAARISNRIKRPIDWLLGQSNLVMAENYALLGRDNRPEKMSAEIDNLCKTFVSMGHTIESNIGQLKDNEAALQEKVAEIQEINATLEEEVMERQAAQEALAKLNSELEGKVLERTVQLQEINATLEEEVMERQAAQEALAKLNAGLEETVLERTTQLQELNAALEEEVMERTAAQEILAELNASLEEEIMERQAAEQRIREQAELLDHAHDYIMVRDLDSRIVYWNQGAEKGYGFTAVEAVGQVTHELLQTEFPESVEAITAKLLAHGSWAGELIHTRKDGVQIIVQSNQTLNRDPAGNPVSMMEINHDITEKKKAEEMVQEANLRLQRFNAELETKVAERTNQLQEINATLEEEIMERQAAQEALRESWEALSASETRYRDLFEHMGSAFSHRKILLDDDGRLADLEFVKCNQAFLRRYGWPAEDVVGKKLSELFPGIEKEKDLSWFQAMSDVALTGRPTEFEEYFPTIGKWFRVSAYRPEPGYVAVISDDITERKQAEEVMQESRERYEAMMKQSSEAIALVDFTTKQFVDVNDAYLRMFGYSREALQTMRSTDIRIDPDVTAPDAAMLRDGFVSAKIERYRRKGGQIIHAERTASLVHHRGAKLVLLTYKDVTEQQKLQAAIQAEAEMAGTVQKALLPPDEQDAGLTVRTVFQPLHIVSGDFYGYRWSHDGSKFHGFLIDVTGHGMATALHTSAISTLLNEAMDNQQEWPETVDRLNRQLTAYFPEGFFVGLIAFTVDLPRRMLTCISCGINYLLVSTQHQVGTMTVPGIFLGLTDTPEFQTRQIPIQNGDAFYFMTDGIFEIMDPAVAEGAHRFEDTVRALQQIATDEKRHDDCSALCIQIAGLSPFPLRFDFNSDEWQHIRERVSGVLADIAGVQAMKIEIALGEAVMNAVQRTTAVCLKINKVGRRLILRVSDCGEGFAGNAALARYARLEKDRLFEAGLDAESGRGLRIMLAWMDKVVYNKQGNEVLLVKKL